MAENKSEMSPGWRAVRSFLIVAAAFVGFLLYACATDVTEINLEEPQEPRRQQLTARVIRSLARPDFFEFDEESRSLNVTIRMPCPEEPKGSRITLEGRLVTLTPNCANTTQDRLRITGEGFRPRTDGIVRWHPPGEVATTRALASFRVDPDGNFAAEFTMPDIRETEEPQRIEVEERWRTGIPRLSDTSYITIEKIIETVFLALMATTVGTILAVPISFLAARNLMVRIGSPLAAIMSAIIVLPFAAVIGGFVSGNVVAFADQVSAQSPVTFGSAVLSLSVVAASWTGGWALLQYGPSVIGSSHQNRAGQFVNLGRLLAIVLLLYFGLAVLANLGTIFGDWLDRLLSPIGFLRLFDFGFLGRFTSLVSELVLVLSPPVIALFAGLIGSSLGSRYGQEAVLRLDVASARIFTALLSLVGGAFLGRGLGEGYIWLYQPDETEFWRLILPVALAVISGIVGAVVQPKRLFPVGITMYSLSRSTLNVIRSIEPLIYVIVFAVWVGIGPFAGVLALTGHTIAALGKLFSEQVENISQGPIEAVTATGANSLQTIVFAVIPQIVPPYIAFTLYRWDINVRFSTVIGFGGGGGIGFVLFQHINLLQYRQASVMMIAIAVVVMTLDYISSQIRSRII